MNKAELQAALTERGVNFDPEATNAVLEKLLENSTPRAERENITAKAPVVPLDDTPKSNVNPVRPGDMKPAGMLNNSWETYLSASLTREQLEDPQLWAFMGPRWQEGDKLRVTADDISWVAEGYVTQVMGRDVRVRFPEGMYHELEARQEQSMRYGDYLIRNGGRLRRYYITQVSTGQDVRDGLPSMIVAMQYLQDQGKANAING